jgi:hypothetical protein
LLSSKTGFSLLAVLLIVLLALQPIAFGDEHKTVKLDVPFVLQVQETVLIDSDFKLSFLGIEADSRCPSDVTCVWEGEVKAQISLEKGQKNLGTHVIPSKINDLDTQIFENYYIRIVEIQPYPTSSTPIKPSEYQLTFLVSKTKETNLNPPLQQFNVGIPINDIQCRDDRVLVIKSHSITPACVKPNSVAKLVERGWAQPTDTKPIEPIIRTGTRSGFCIGYCFSEFTITSEKIVYSGTGREFISDSWEDLPDKTSTHPITNEDWNELVSFVDFEKFNSLPDQFGCPGCADASVEWIEISYGAKTKKIEFEAREAIPEITQLIVKLQEIRKSTVDSVIDSFEDCVFAGYPVMESYPRQCRANDGQNFVEDITPIMIPQEKCQAYNGVWLQEFSECEGISEQQCSSMNGVFHECESACRNMPEAEVCTTQCVLVCEIP